ncbi:hypothetical protein [Micromonospora aurantiaca (nom. illeg.)]|uniref:hypothetical protein n=1 Tax=Micromonospora aurantiaca (nom. illeg.) TaxID=47850 RepID=UPI0033E8D6FE
MTRTISQATARAANRTDQLACGTFGPRWNLCAACPWTAPTGPTPPAPATHYTWLPESDIYPGHLTSGVVDTAHQLAELYLDAGDTAGARWAIGQAWLADPHRGDDGPWRDLMRAAQMDGRTAEVRNLLSELMCAREAEVPEDLSKETYAWVRPLLPEVLAGSY